MVWLREIETRFILLLLYPPTIIFPIYSTSRIFIEKRKIIYEMKIYLTFVIILVYTYILYTL